MIREQGLHVGDQLGVLGRFPEILLRLGELGAVVPADLRFTAERAKQQTAPVL